MNRTEVIKHTLIEVALVFLIAFGWAALSGIEDLTLGILHISSKSLPLNLYMLSTMYCEGIAVIAMLIRYRKRPLLLGTTTGHRNAVREYLIGMLWGGIAFTVIWALIAIQGGYALRFVFRISNWWLIILYSFGFMIQSLLEELVCRGYVMGYWLKRGHVIVAILLNSWFFMFLHRANPGYNSQAALGIFLFGILMSLLRLQRGSIWLGAAFHAMWNFFEGIVFGTAVSGLPNVGLIVKSFSHANSQVSGRIFGLESSPTSIVVHLVLIAFVLFIINKNPDTGTFKKQTLTH